MAQADVKDRYRTWRADPETPPEPRPAAAFAEGFMQGMEFSRMAMGEDPADAIRFHGSITSAELTADWDDPE